MADFMGIGLIGKGPIGGSALILGEDSDASGIVKLPNDIEVEIRRGVPAVVVRGIKASNYDSVMRAAPELANRGLDIFAMTGVARLALADVWSKHVAWWSTQEAAIARVWFSMTFPLSSQAKAVVLNAGKAIDSPNAEVAPSWHDSMRYFRMSEITDDLFDAFRNVYLSLESLLNMLAPRRIKADGKFGEGEGEWFKRALRVASGTIDLNPYLPESVPDPAYQIYVELYKGVRNNVFHSKSTLDPILPQDPSSRTTVADAKSRYGQLYLDLAAKLFGSRFPTGGLRIYSGAARTASDVITNGWSIGLMADPEPTDVSDDFEPERAKLIKLPTEPSMDPRSDRFSVVVARMTSHDMPASSVVDRILAFKPDGRPAFTQSLGGRLDLDGFDCCEFSISVSMTGTEIRKALYAT